MSLVLMTLQSAPDHLAALAAVPVHAAVHASNTGIFDWVNTKSDEAKVTIIRVGGVIALIFVIAAAWRARGGLGAILVAMIGAALFIWVLSNIDTVADKVGNEMNGAPAVHVTPDRVLRA